MRYFIIDAKGNVVNEIVWDGVSDYTPPEGCSLVLPENYNPPQQG